MPNDKGKSDMLDVHVVLIDWGVVWLHSGDEQSPCSVQVTPHVKLQKGAVRFPRPFAEFQVSQLDAAL